MTQDFIESLAAVVEDLGYAVADLVTARRHDADGLPGFNVVVDDEGEALPHPIRIRLVPDPDREPDDPVYVEYSVGLQPDEPRQRQIDPFLLAELNTKVMIGHFGMTDLGFSGYWRYVHVAPADLDPGLIEDVLVMAVTTIDELGDVLTEPREA